MNLDRNIPEVVELLGEISRTGGEYMSFAKETITTDPFERKEADTICDDISHRKVYYPGDNLIKGCES